MGPINPSVLKERLEKILVTYVLDRVTDERIVDGHYYRKFGECEMKISGNMSKYNKKISFLRFFLKYHLIMKIGISLNVML